MPGERPAADTVAAIASRTSTWLQGLASQKACMARRVSRRGMAEDGTKRRRRGECGRPGRIPARGALGTRGAAGRTNAPRRALKVCEARPTRRPRASARVRAYCGARARGMPPLRRRSGNRVPARCHRASGKFFRTKKFRRGSPSSLRWAPEPHHAFENPPRHHGQSGRLEDTHHSEPRASRRGAQPRGAPASPAVLVRVWTSSFAGLQLLVVASLTLAPHPSQRWTSHAASASPTRTGRSDTSWT